MKQLAILGVSGSIGQQCCKVIKEYPSKFQLVAVTLHQQIELLPKLLSEFPSIHTVCVTGDMELAPLIHSFPNVTFLQKEEGLLTIVSLDDVKMVVNALVGFVGLRPTLKAIEQHKEVALANKESMVVGGELVNAALAKYQGKLYPIDSEHSAIFQCLVGEKKDQIRSLYITASGGSFRDKTLQELENVTVKEALHHPNWVMGKKITIDSATLVNKGLEVMEAHHLFQVDYQNIHVLLHPESTVHSMVEFIDGSIKAQLGITSMEIPIQYALAQGNHLMKQEGALSFEQARTLHFAPIDPIRFPALPLAYEVGRTGGTMPAVFNAANEIAVAAFLNQEISFLSIIPVIKNTLEQHKLIKTPTLQDIVQADAWARNIASTICKEEQRRIHS